MPNDHDRAADLPASPDDASTEQFKRVDLYGFVEVNGSNYTWRPPAELEGLVPADFRLELECRVVGGAQCFLPTDMGFNALILTASVGGLALLTKLRGADAEQQETYHQMRLIWQQTPHVIEHLTRRFNAESDLYIAKSAGSDVDDILPDHFGLGDTRRTERVRPGELVARGRSAARELSRPAEGLQLGVVCQ